MFPYHIIFDEEPECLLGAAIKVKTSNTPLIDRVLEFISVFKSFFFFFLNQEKTEHFL